jgi:hypothetical protein
MFSGDRLKAKRAAILVGAIGVAAIGIVAGLLYFVWQDDKLPTRAECLQRIDIADIAPSRQHDYDQVVFFFLSDDLRARAPQASGFGFGRDRSEVYVRLRTECDQKADILRPIIERFNSIHGDVARLELYPGRVEPGPDTLMFRGPYWRDRGRLGQPCASRAAITRASSGRCRGRPRAGAADPCGAPTWPRASS